MKHRLCHCLTVFAAFVMFAAMSYAQQLRYSHAADMQKSFEHVPCHNKERLETVRSLFQEMGAPAESISAEKQKGVLHFSADVNPAPKKYIPYDVTNLVVTKQGRTDDRIIIGAHYDFVESGCGAVDNWTGIVALAHLYRSILNVQSEKTLLFVAFDKEEVGLLGSQAMASAISKEEAKHYCAMINLDSFTTGAPFVLKSASSPKLWKLAADTAEKMKVPFHVIEIPANSDSSSFIGKNIPSLTISGLTENWRSILHTAKDQAKEVNPDSMYLGYRLALAMWYEVDQAPCDQFR